MAATSRTLVFVPTYNEAGNVRPLFDEIEGLGLRPDYLFLDDASPDGASRILDQLAAECARFRVIHRSGKLGIGTAHRAGIEWAYDTGYHALITLDCDFTHSPWRNCRSSCPPARKANPK